MAVSIVSRLWRCAFAAHYHRRDLSGPAPPVDSATVLMNTINAFLGDGISQYDMKCHHHLGSVERFWWVVYISAARLNLGSGESSLSTYCSYYWTPWWFWDFLATGEKINRDLSGFWLKDSKKLNIRGISKSIRHFIRHSTTSQRWPVPVGPWTDLTINWYD